MSCHHSVQDRRRCQCRPSCRCCVILRIWRPVLGIRQPPAPCQSPDDNHRCHRYCHWGSDREIRQPGSDYVAATPADPFADRPPPGQWLFQSRNLSAPGQNHAQLLAPLYWLSLKSLDRRPSRYDRGRQWRRWVCRVGTAPDRHKPRHYRGRAFSLTAPCHPDQRQR